MRTRFSTAWWTTWSPSSRASKIWSRGRAAPAGDVRVELAGPGGERWVWGDEGAPDRIVGPAVDFCRVVTRRRLPADTELVVTGPAAEEWIGLAQAFAGPAGADPKPRS